MGTADADAATATEGMAVLAAAARGLAELHEAGLVHGDVKPDNLAVSLRRPDDACWVDYDAVRRDGQSSEAIIGTPAYMAPEQRRGEPAAATDDVYAFGVMLAETLLGVEPGEVRALTPRFWRGLRELCRPLAAVLLRCLNSSPARRPTMVEVGRLLEALLTQDGGVQRPRRRSLGTKVWPLRCWCLPRARGDPRLRWRFAFRPSSCRRRRCCAMSSGI